MSSIRILVQVTAMPAKTNERRGQTVFVRHVLQYYWTPLLADHDTMRDAQWGPREGPFNASVLGPPDDDFMNLTNFRDEVARRHGLQGKQVAPDWQKYEGQHPLRHGRYWDDGFIDFRQVPRDISQDGKEMRPKR